MTEQVKSPEDMSLAELREAAFAEAEQVEQAEKPRDAQGRFVAETVVAPTEEVQDPPVADEPDTSNNEPEEFILSREIDLEDGSGVQVFRGRGTTELEAAKDLNDKFYEAQKNATKKIRELNARVKVEDTRTAQQKLDEEYVVAERLKTDPTKTIREVMAQVRREEQEFNERSLAAQRDFVSTHPDYISDESNGTKVRDWVQSHNYTEFSADNLEKAYQDLKKSGLLKLKSEEASGTTDAERKETERIAQVQRDAAQSRSSTRGSSISTRGSRAPVIKTEPSEDELASMPMDKLRELSNKQLAERQQ